MIVRWRTVATVLLLVAGALAWLGASNASAQEEEGYPLQVLTLQCEEATCTEENAVPIGDVLVIVSSEDGATEYGTCTTTAEEGCTLSVPAGETVTVSVDESTIPSGYVALDYPISFQTPLEATGEPDVTIAFSLQQDTVPDDSDTDDEVAEEDDSGIDELPETGAGAGITETNEMPLYLMSLSVLLALGATAFIAVRRADR